MKIERIQVIHHLLSLHFVIFSMFALTFSPFLAGIFSAITFLIHEPKGALCILLYPLFLFFKENMSSDINLNFLKKYKNLLLFLSGTAVVMIIFFLPFILTNSLSDYINAFVFMLTNYHKFDKYPFLYSEIQIAKQNLSSGVFFTLTFITLFFTPFLLSIILIGKLVILQLFRKSNSTESSIYLSIYHLIIDCESYLNSFRILQTRLPENHDIPCSPICTVYILCYLSHNS